MKKERMNNKGFSLVELIIVIAIMAVLVVALAPQYLKYVEKSRNSTDVNNATAMVTAVQVYAADPDAADPFEAGKSFTITVDSTKATVAGDQASSATAALTDASLNPNNIVCKSKTTWTQYVITGTVQTNGGITFTYTSTPGGTPDPFADAMK